MIKKNNIVSTEELKKVIIEAMQDSKAQEIVALNLKALEGVTDYYIICHGDSTTQVNAIASFVEKEVKEKIKQKPYKTEGERAAQWVIIDYIDVVVHVFHKETRAFYQLEELWSDAERESFSLDLDPAEQVKKNLQKLKTIRTKKLNEK